MHLPASHRELVLDHGDRRVIITVEQGRPELTVRVGERTLATVSLGFDLDGLDVGANARVVDSSARSVRESYRAHVGKAIGVREYAHDELTVSFESGSRPWGVEVRASRDGVAFRYVLPGSAGKVGPERTVVRTDGDARAWVLDYQTWYETPRFGADLAELPAGAYGFPLLIRLRDADYLLVSESSIDGRHSGAHVEFDGAAFAVRTADASLAFTNGYTTPWRVVMCGALTDIVQSTFVDELAPPSESGESALVPRPGRAAWSWWSSQYSGASFEVQRRFCDFAAEQGWEHLLVDCGWDAAWIPELVAYASERHIQVHLWSSWSDLDGEVNLEKLALWRSWGVAGVKVDFMESESQARYEWYDAIIAEAARVGMMLNFHGSVIPRGWARTHPHIMSYEAIRGAEWYVFYHEALTAAHNVLQPFTRNVVGSMDYTPVTFSAPQRETSDAHELALSVVFESGITHYADDPDQYRARPLAAIFLAEAPSAWDETVLVEGDPDSHAVLARRSGDRWFIGGISALSAELDVHLDLSRLVDTPSDIWTVTDLEGELAGDVRESQTFIDLRLAPRGGFVAIVAPNGTSTVRAAALPRQSLPAVERRISVLSGESVLLEGRADRVRHPAGWVVFRESEDRWRASPHVAPMPGEVAVFSFESDGAAGVPAISHARVLAPLTGGPIAVSTLPFISARNEVGPVERGRANGGGDPRDGEPLSVNGRTFDDGIGVSQDSEVTFAIAGDRRLLSGLVAVDDETPRGSAWAEIEIDGDIALSLPVAGSRPPHPFSLDVTGATRIALRTRPVAGSEETHVDWLELQLIT